MVFFDPAHEAEAAARHLLERQTAWPSTTAIETELYFQPKVDAVSGRRSGPRCCCAGGTRSAAWSALANSSRWPNRAASSGR